MLCNAVITIAIRLQYDSGIGPTLYIIMKSDLAPLSRCNQLLKYADDTTLLVPENSDTELGTEFNHITDWAVWH